MIIDLVNDIDYVDDGINRRCVFDNEQSSLLLLAFKKGTERAMHYDEEDEAAVVVEGEAQISVADKTYRVKAGQMVLLPKGLYHGLKAITDVKLVLLSPKHTHES